MDNNKSRISELTAEIENNNCKLNNLYQIVGERVAHIHEKSENNDELLPFLNELSGFDNKLDEVDLVLKDLHKSYNRIIEISEREKVLGEEYSRIEKINKNLFLPAGKAAYTQWKTDPEESLAKTMESSVVLEKKLETHENEIFQLKNKMKAPSIIKKIKVKGKMTLLGSRIKSCQSLLEKNYKHIGEKIYKKDLSFFEKINDESVLNIMQNRQILNDFENEIKKLKSENSELEKYLKSKFKSSKQEKAEEKINQEKKNLLIEQGKKFTDFGLFIFQGNLYSDNKEVADSFSDIKSLLKENENFVEEIDKKKALLEIVKLEEEVLDMKKNIKELQQTIENCNNDISEFNKEIKRARSEIKKFKKISENEMQETDQ